MAATSSRRLRTPNLSNATVRCSWTVLAEMCSSSTICRVEWPLMTSATTRDCAPVSPYALSSSELSCAAGVGSMTMPICGVGPPPSRDACRESHRPARPRSRIVSASCGGRSEEHTSELQSPYDLVCRLLLEKKKKKLKHNSTKKIKKKKI